MKDNRKIDFDANSPYSLDKVSEILGQTVHWVRTNAIKTGELQHAPMGNQVVVYGKWITEFVISKGTFEGDDNCPISNRGKHKRSPRKKTDEGDATS